jgi:hypothetical protein
MLSVVAAHVFLCVPFLAQLLISSLDAATHQTSNLTLDILSNSSRTLEFENGPGANFNDKLPLTSLLLFLMPKLRNTASG